MAWEENLVDLFDCRQLVPIPPIVEFTGDYKRDQQPTVVWLRRETYMRPPRDPAGVVPLIVVRSTFRESHCIPSTSLRLLGGVPHIPNTGALGHAEQRH